MVPRARWMLVPALLGLLLAAPLAAQTRTEYVQDEAALFSKDAKAKANAEIARMYAQFKRELVVDTVFSIKVPPEVDAKNEAALKRYLDEWAEKRAGREKVNGIALTIIGEPRTIRVEIGNRTKASGLFTEADRQELRNQVIANMKDLQKDPTNQRKKDHVLLAATSFVYDRMSEHHRQASAPPQVPVGQNQGEHRQRQETPWLMYILIGIGILIVFWVIRAVVRGLSGGMGGGGPRMAGGGYGGGPGGGYGGGGYGGGGGGGGFMSGMLGGLFGAVAGNWMYNNFFGGHSSMGGGSAWGAGPAAGAGGATGTDADTSYSGDGGDYGDTGAGAGTGGQDAGTGNDGGDWGGGGGADTGADAGGGGGDWGGGGGGDAGGGGDWGGGGGGDFGGGGGGDFGGGGGGGGDW